MQFVFVSFVLRWCWQHWVTPTLASRQSCYVISSSDVCVCIFISTTATTLSYLSPLRARTNQRHRKPLTLFLPSILADVSLCVPIGPQSRSQRRRLPKRFRSPSRWLAPPNVRVCICFFFSVVAILSLCVCVCLSFLPYCWSLACGAAVRTIPGCPARLVHVTYIYIIIGSHTLSQLLARFVVVVIGYIGKIVNPVVVAVVCGCVLTCDRVQLHVYVCVVFSGSAQWSSSC